VLNPQETWADAQAYARQARALAEQFAQNARSFADQVSSEVLAAGPLVSVG
jgi:phosphoenolpyruvate carboxykinase (ATP)